jgi:hypothetical protein
VTVILRRLRCDAGTTLIEALMTIAIMAACFAAILGGVSTQILMSDLHRKQASAQTILRSYADAIEASTTWRGCAAVTGDYAPGQMSYSDYPSGYTPSATAVKYWDAAGATFTSTCTTDPGLQLVTIQVRTDRATESMDVVKRCLGARTAAGGPCP